MVALVSTTVKTCRRLREKLARTTDEEECRRIVTDRSRGGKGFTADPKTVQNNCNRYYQIGSADLRIHDAIGNQGTAYYWRRPSR